MNLSLGGHFSSFSLRYRLIVLTSHHLHLAQQYSIQTIAGVPSGYFGGSPISVHVGGLISTVTGQASETDDFSASFESRDWDNPMFSTKTVWATTRDGIGAGQGTGATGTLVISRIPEPSTASLLIVFGFLGVLQTRQRDGLNKN